MNSKPLDLACRACLIAGVLLLIFAAIQVHALLISALLALAAWRVRRPPPLTVAYGSAAWCSEKQAAAAGLFWQRGLFLGRFAGPPPLRLHAVLRLFTLPVDRSAQAVMEFLALFIRR
jgi:hypothetical protein